MSDRAQPEPSRSPGILQLLATGYGLVWRLRRPLAVTVGPALATALALHAVVGLIWTGDAVAIVDGWLLTSGTTGPALLVSAVLVVGWAIAITVGVAVTGRFLLENPPEATDVGTRREPGPSVSPHWRAIRAAAGQIGLVVVPAIGGGVAGLLILGALVTPLNEFGIVVFAAGLLAIAMAIARLLFCIAATVLDSETTIADLFAITRDHAWATAGAFLIGGVGIPWGATALLSAIRDGLAEHGGTTLVMVLTGLADLWLVIVVMIQAGLLTTGYLYTREMPSVVDERLGTDDAGRHHRIRTRTSVAAIALIALPALVSAGVTWWNPYDAVDVTSEPNGGIWRARYAVWPDDGHPAFADDTVIEDCMDITCSDTRWRTPAHPLDLGAAFMSDGTLVSALGQWIDGRILLQRCSIETCEEEWISSDGRGVDSALLAVAAADDGTVWLAEARDVTEHQDEQGTDGPPHEQAELALTRCTDWTCAERSTTSLGKVDASIGAAGGVFGGSMFDDSSGAEQAGRVFSYPPRQLTAGLDDEGKPLLMFRGRGSVWLGTCDPGDCASPRLIRHSQPLDRVIPLGDAEEGVLGWSANGQLMSCVDLTCDSGDDWIPGIPPATPLGDMAVQLTPHGLLAVVVEPAPAAGVQITIGGEPAQQWLTSLIQCTNVSCEDATTIPLSMTDDHPSRAVILTRDDGRVLVLTINEAISLRLPEARRSPESALPKRQNAVRD